MANIMNGHRITCCFKVFASLGFSATSNTLGGINNDASFENLIDYEHAREVNSTNGLLP
jgi:hypothetical protein